MSSAYPDLELKVSTSPDNACLAVLCPYCDNEIPLHWPHECGNCGADLQIDLKWAVSSNDTTGEADE